MSSNLSHAYSQETDQEVGFVTKVYDYIIRLEGFPSIRIYDCITNGSSLAYITELSSRSVEAHLLWGDIPKPGDKFIKQIVPILLPTHSVLFGRIINPIGKPIDGLGSFPPGGEPFVFEAIAPGVHERETISEQVYTGITMIDTLVPLGKGQRELIFGDARSGKDIFLLDVIANQRGRDMICIYCVIGKSDTQTKRFHEQIRRSGADRHTIMVAATSSDYPPMIAIAPHVACSLAEHYAKKGKHVLLIQDDLGTHAKYCREIALLAGRVPGRESYPADMFFEHSRMLERAGNFHSRYGGGSITMLPVVETDLENMTNLIPTNVMSMTDGHMSFSSSLHFEGQYPAVDVEKSVTRVGKQTQSLVHKALAEKIMILLAEYIDLERFSRFGSDLAEETQKKLKRGRVMRELISQPRGVFIESSYQIMLLSLVFVGYFDDKDIRFVHEQKMNIIECFQTDEVFQRMATRIHEYTVDDICEELSKNISLIDSKIGSQSLKPRKANAW